MTPLVVVAHTPAPAPPKAVCAPRLNGEIA